MAEGADLEIQLLRNLHSRTDYDEVYEWFTLSQICEATIYPADPDQYEQRLSSDIDDIANTIESLIDRKYVEMAGPGSVYETPFRLTLAGEFFEDSSNRPAIDSSRWTGLSLSTQQIEELVANVRRALDCVDGLSLTQERKAQVRSLLSAALTLSEAPDPPLDIIAQLLGSADRIMNMTGLFLGIASILIGFVQ